MARAGIEPDGSGCDRRRRFDHAPVAEWRGPESNRMGADATDVAGSITSPSRNGEGRNRTGWERMRPTSPVRSRARRGMARPESNRMGADATDVAGSITRPSRNGEGRNRTGDTTIFSRVLYQLSYLAARADGSGR